MTGITSVGSTVTAAFLASFVEVVEAFTIVLAVGLTRGWRPAFQGTALAFVVLALIVAIFGPVISSIPIEALQFVVGSLLILFGMRWLRKAILRASGHMALHDETAAFAKETDVLIQQKNDRRADYLAATAAFKAVLLEGVEVVFIVVAIGAGHQMIGFASLGALAAFVLVLAAGLIVHRPLARVPENTLKFAVGLMLTSFGIFWTGEGLGTEWPGADLSLFGLFAVLTLFSLALVRWLKDPMHATAREGLK